MPILRPLLSEDKNDIREEAERIGTFQYSKIDSACPDMAPDSLSTELSEERRDELEQKVGLDDLVNEAYSDLEIRVI